MPKVKLHQSQQLTTALIAGAAGFIGSHLCEILLAQNCRVYGIDNWTTGKKKNISHLLEQPRFVFLEQDIDKPFETSLPRLDYIFHLAGIDAYLSGPDVSLETLLVNSLGTRELLELAKKNSAKFLLASTADILSGWLAGTDLDHYFGSEPKREEVYSHREAKRFSETLTFEYLDRFQTDCRIVRLGLVYGPRMSLKSDNDIGRLLNAVKNNETLEIFGQGIKALYPTYISDAVYGLTKAMFSQSSGGRIFTLVNPEKITLLNLAYKLKQQFPQKNLKIEFKPGAEEETVLSLSAQALTSQQVLGWEPKVALDQGLAATVRWLESGKLPTVPKKKPATALINEPEYTAEELGVEPAKPVSVNHKQRFKLKLKFAWPHWRRPKLKIRPLRLSRRWRWLLVGFGALTLYLIFPAILMVLTAFRATSALKETAGLTDFSQASRLMKLAKTSQDNFNRSRGWLQFSHPITVLVGGQDLTTGLDSLLFTGGKLSQGIRHLAKAGEAGTVLAQIIFKHQDGNLNQAIKDINLNLDEAYTELSFVESELQSGREQKSGILAPLSAKLQTLTGFLPSVRGQINQARLLLPLLPGFVAADGKKTYLLLMQNSSELRPTGGFIGSYGLLTFEKGKLLDFAVQDIYSADGQLKGFVKPPEPLVKFLGQNNWYFRDSNWDPDFPVSAQRAEWFLGKTTDRSVDGVIAVNLPAVKELLQATGPINLPDYNEEVTADNLFERAEYRSEIDFFPGSSQKKDFLGSLAREIFNQMQNSSGTQLIKFSQALQTALNQKQLLVYLHDQDGQRVMVEQNWAGTIFNPRLKGPDNRPVTSDYAYLVEANLGINKANYFLKRDIRQELSILKNKEILAITTIDYQNQSPADVWPGGVYRSYVREYLPLGSSLVSVKVGDDRLNLNSVDKAQINDKLVIGFPVTVAVKSALTVEVTYRLPDPLALANRQGRLAMIIPKQPGTFNDQLTAVINYPSFLSVSSLSPVGQLSSQVVEFKSDLNLDRVFTVDFTER